MPQYLYLYRYFAVPNDYGSPLKSHIIRPHTTETMCGSNAMEMDSHSLGYDLRQDCCLCGQCLRSLRTLLDSRGTAAVSLHVFRALVDRLKTLEQ